MAVSPKITGKQRCTDKTILFEDSTKDYNATYNTTGYGSPNELRTAITQTSIEITTPDNDYYIRSGNDTELSIYNLPYLPKLGNKIYLQAHGFTSYNREPDPVTITSSNGGKVTVYFTASLKGNLKISLLSGNPTGVYALSSTTNSDVTLSIIEGVTTVAQIKTALETHEGVYYVTTSGTTYTFGDTIIEGKEGQTKVSKKQLNKFSSGCHKIRYRIYKSSITAGTPLTPGNLYCVHGADYDEWVTYNGVNYLQGEIIRANSTTAFTVAGGSVRLSELVGEVESYFVYWCPIRKHIKDIVLLSSEDKCEGCKDFVESLANLDTMLSSAMVAIEEDNVDCGCEEITKIEEVASEFLKRCC